MEDGEVTIAHRRCLSFLRWKTYQKPVQNPDEKVSIFTNPSIKHVKSNENKRARQEEKLCEKGRPTDGQITYI